MQLKKRNKLSIGRPETLLNHSNDDFTSILNESPWERFVDKTKPLVKILLVVAIIGGSIYGGTLLFGDKDSSKQSTEYASNNADHQSDDKEKLHQCLDDVAKANSSPETSDPEFYKKLIDGYDKRLGCYEKYPGIDLAGKSQVEENRKSAIDSSGTYKDIYLANGGSYEYKPTSTVSHTNPTTGCNYGLSESEYIKCTDNYNSRHGTSVSRTPPSVTQTKPTPNMTASPETNNTALCSAKKAEVHSLYSQYQSARNSADAVRSKLSSVDYSRPPGFTGTQSQLDAWRASEKQRLQNELSPLQSAERVAQQKYNTAQSEYSARGCY